MVTCVDAILGPAGLDEDFEIDEAEGHEAKGEPGHEAREGNQADDDKQIDPELSPAAGSVSSRHVSLLYRVGFSGGQSSTALRERGEGVSSTRPSPSRRFDK